MWIMRKRKIFVSICLLSIIAIFSTSCGQEKESIYPVYEKKDDYKLWGYIDKEGKYKVEPQFINVEEFDENGLAKVHFPNGEMNMINTKGELFLEQNCNAMTNFSEGIATMVRGNECIFIDRQGKELFRTKDYIAFGECKNGRLAIAKRGKDNNILAGYADKKGKVVIKPKYAYAWDFVGDNTIVQTDEGKVQIIDKKGNVIKKLPYSSVFPDEKGETFMFENDKSSYGYLNDKGDVIIKPKYKGAFVFKDDMAVVTTDDPSKGSAKWGVIDKKGNYIIKPKYTYISYLGNELFAVSKDKYESPQDSKYVNKAIMTKDGTFLTDFSYLDIGEVQKHSNKYLISVSDGKKTMFLDKKGKPVSKFPALEGMGQLIYDNGLVKGVIDNRQTYYTLDGKEIWKEDNSYNLTANEVVREEKYKPNTHTTIYYPQVEGLKDEKVEKAINEILKKEFLENEDITDAKKLKDTAINGDYEIKQINDLLIVTNNTYYYTSEAGRDIQTKKIYHISLNNGKLYELEDLFKKDVDYIAELSSIIKKQMQERMDNGQGMYFIDNFDTIREDQEFMLDKDKMEIYFYPLEVDTNMEGFTTFDIPYNEIMHLIDTKSEFWWDLLVKKGDN